MLIIVIFGMVFIAISEIQSNAAHPNPFNYGTCPNGQFNTAITTSSLDCGSPPAQTNEYYGTCPVNQYATAITTTTLNCASASNSNYLTTQTAVSTEISASCLSQSVAINESSSGAFQCKLPKISGEPVLLYKDTNRYIKSMTLAAQKIGASYTVPANSYTYILIESAGYVGYTALSNTQIVQIINFAGGSQVDNVFFSQIIPCACFVLWTTSTMESFTAGGNATVVEQVASANDAQTNIYQTSFYVYGIV